MNQSVASRRILLTGAGGFVGGWLLRALHARLAPGLKILALGHTAEIISPAVETEIISPAIETSRLDITDRATVDAMISRLKPTVVVHLAAISAVYEAGQAPRRAWDVNLFGTMNLAQSVLQHCPEARFVHVSSSEIYGGGFKAGNGPLDETASLDPSNAYATSKAAADLMVGQIARDGLKAVRVRPFNHTGPGQTERFVIPAFAAQIARIEAGSQEPVIRVGNLEARRDFLDVRDVVDAYVGLALSPDPFEPGLVLNVASGTPRRIGDILDELVSLARVPIRIEIDPSRMRANDTPLAIGDASRIRGLLGWENRTPWSTTLADVLGFWRATERV